MSGGVDELVASSDASLIVFTTAAHDQRAGCLVGFHTQCSIEPFRYAVWLSKANHSYRVALFADHFAVHFLDRGDRKLAELFGTKSEDDVDKFSMCRWSSGPGGVPILADVPSVLFERHTLWDDGSDHVCVVGSPVDVVNVAPFAPLRTADARQLEAGHDAEERPVPDPEPVSSQRADDLRDAAAGFGHELTEEQIAQLESQHEQAVDESTRRAGDSLDR